MIKLVNSILGQAVSEGASDIHFEREEKEMRIRFRVDGVLQEAAKVPQRMVNGVVSRIKIMSDLDIAEKRMPQDGRVGINIEDRRVDLRVTTLPTQRGEGCTDPHPRQKSRAAHARRARHGRRTARALRDELPPALRRGAGHRARPAPASRPPSTPRSRS